MISQAAPDRTEAITIRLSPEEKLKLVRFALAEDLRLGQLARRLINRQLAVLDSEETGGAPSDGA